jgi:hypothetical protein
MQMPCHAAERRGKSESRFIFLYEKTGTFGSRLPAARPLSSILIGSKFETRN